MARAKKTPASTLRKQVPAQKKRPRKLTLPKIERIPREEAYKRLLALRGKVHLTYDIDELREDRD